MKRRQGSTTRGPLAAAMMAGALALGLSGCSPGVDYPSIFPAVHDMPPPRSDTPMNSDQVQQATEDLITDRDHLNAQAQGAAGQDKTQNPAGTTAKAAAVKKKPASATQAAVGSAPAAATSGTQTAGAESK